MTDSATFDFSNTPGSATRPPFGYAPADALAPPAVSIVTAYFNTGPVFHETAQSVMRQSLQQFEWIIVNDGSTDGEALAVLDTYRNGDTRLRIIDFPANRGANAARNAGAAAARTQYLVQLDADDLLEPTAIEKWLWFLVTHPEAAFVNGHTVGFGAEEYLWRKGFDAGNVFLTKNLVSGRSMIRRSVYEQVGGFDEANRQGLLDWDLWLRCAAAGHWGVTIHEFHDWYRRRPTHTDRWANWRPERVEAFRKEARRRFPQLWQANGFPSVPLRPHMPYAAMPEELPCANGLSKEKRRLLLIAPFMVMGGAENFNLDVIAGLVQRGWEVTIATTVPSDNPWLERFARLTPDIFALPNFLRPVDYPRFLRYLIAARQIDAVFLSNSEPGYLLLPYLRAHFPSLPIVDYCHMEDETRRSGGFPRVSLIYHDLLDATGVTSQHLRQWMMQRGADPEKVVVQYSNVNTEMWRADPEARARVRRELGVGEDPVLFFFGRLTPQKQPRVLARVALNLKQMGENFVMLVAGDGEEMPWLKKFVRQHKLEQQVRLLGDISQGRVKEILSAADLLFLPSHNEGIAAAIYEAMSCGLPVVAADVGGQRELVTPDCGILVPHVDEPADVLAYTSVLGDLLHDTERREKMGAAGRARVEGHFRLDQMADTMLAMIDAAIDRRAAAPAPPISVAMGQALATQAVEFMRLAGEVRPRQAAGPGTITAPARRLPVRVRRIMRRSLGWAITPGPRLASVLRPFKRAIPLRLKVGVKRAIK